MPARNPVGIEQRNDHELIAPCQCGIACNHSRDAIDEGLHRNRTRHFGRVLATEQDDQMGRRGVAETQCLDRPAVVRTAQFERGSASSGRPSFQRLVVVFCPDQLLCADHPFASRKCEQRCLVVIAHLGCQRARHSVLRQDRRIAMPAGQILQFDRNITARRRFVAEGIPGAGIDRRRVFGGDEQRKFALAEVCTARRRCSFEIERDRDAVRMTFVRPRRRACPRLRRNKWGRHVGRARPQHQRTCD